MSKKILNHPDRDEIIKMLNDGESVRKVSAWSKEKYPTNKSLHLSTVTLQKFRKDSLQLDGKVLKDIQETAAVQQRALEEQQRQAQLESSNAYQEKINEIANTHLDVARKILQLDTIIENRIEYWFNAIGTGDATPQQADKELRQYMDRQMVMLQQYKKFVEGMADKTIDHNVNITVMNDQIVVIRDAIKDVLSEFSPEVAIKFMDKLDKKLSNLSYSPESPGQVNTKTLESVEVQVLSDDENYK
jgi:hypothetical protein